MYGVPADLDLSLLQGAQLTQVCLGQFDVQFHFQPVGAITVTGAWELFDEAGVSLDHSGASGSRPQSQFPRLLGQEIVGITVVAPHHLELKFARGDSLRLIDDSKEFESFTIGLSSNAKLIVV